MDPNATCRKIEDCVLCGNIYDACEACEDLRVWISKGGFSPNWLEYPIARKQYIKHCNEGCLS